MAWEFNRCSSGFIGVRHTNARRVPLCIQEKKPVDSEAGEHLAKRRGGSLRLLSVRRKRDMAITKKTFFYWIVALAILGGLGFWYYGSVTGIVQEIQDSILETP